MSLSTCALVFGTLVDHAIHVSAHSWLDCADWDDATGSCRGYARNFHKRPAVPLGQDVGRDNRPGRDVPEGLVCEQQKEKINNVIADGYSSQYPMAVVTPGQQLVWRWPAKNHAQVGTQRGVQIFISKGPGLGDDFSHITSKSAWLSQHPGLTHTFSNCYQNGAKVGPNVDRADCYGTFQLPADLQSGVYTFMWWWEFNGGEYYNSCADISVVASGNGNVPRPAPSPPPTPRPTPRAVVPVPTPQPVSPTFPPSLLPSAQPTKNPVVPTPSPRPVDSSSCPLVGRGLPMCTSECYCGFTGIDGSGCGVDDGSSCWCKCCCHFRGGCSYRMNGLDPNLLLSSSVTTSMSAVAVGTMMLAF